MHLRRAVLLPLVALVIACSGGDPASPSQPDTQQPTPVATSVSLSATSVTMDALGATQQVAATVRDQNGQTMAGAPVSWSTSDAQVASVSSGTITAAGNGSATVTATAGSASAAVAVTVAQVAASVTVSPSELSFSTAGESVQLSAQVLDSQGSQVAGSSVQWASSDDGVATVDAQGLVTAVADGTVTITATSGSVVGSVNGKVEILVTAHEANRVAVPVGGNAWIINSGGEVVGENGVDGWSTAGSVVRTYFRVTQPGQMVVSANVVGAGAPSQLTLTMGEVTRTLNVSGSAEAEYFAGEFTVAAAGYVAVDLAGVSTQGATFGRPVSINVSGSAVTTDMSYIQNNDGNMFYWGRRGPSTHLLWEQPAINVRWMYSELTVPTGEDVEGTYFMANGFDAGYFGMQVNGPDRRQFLFSIWSPFDTEDPNSIPDSLKIKLNRKGADVTVGEFGNEGSGGQSYLEFMWSAGTTYKFLTEIKPNGDGTTDFTAWVNIPETGGWRLIASFRRPQTDAWGSGMYSFLENFYAEQGNVTRMGLYGNQWVADENGNWQEIRNLTFSTDNTGAQGFRKDYAGGISGATPFMKMGGFFNEFTVRGTAFTRDASQGPPNVDLGGLP